MPRMISQPRTPQDEPDYVHWRANLLAQLALSKLTGVTVYQNPQDSRFDFLVAGADGFCFFVEVKAFSSLAAKLRKSQDGSFAWSIQSSVIANARRSRSPVVLFLFDADTEEGWCIRLDTLSEPKPGSRQVALKFADHNRLNTESLKELVEHLVV